MSIWKAVPQHREVQELIRMKIPDVEEYQMQPITGAQVIEAANSIKRAAGADGWDTGQLNYLDEIESSCQAPAWIVT